GRPSPWRIGLRRRRDGAAFDDRVAAVATCGRSVRHNGTGAEAMAPTGRSDRLWPADGCVDPVADFRAAVPPTSRSRCWQTPLAGGTDPGTRRRECGF